MEPRLGSNSSPNPVGTPVFRVTTRTGPPGPVPNPDRSQVTRNRCYHYAYDSIIMAILLMRPTITCYTSVRLLYSCNVVSKHYAPDKNQTIHRTISCQPTHQTHLILDILQSYDLVVGTSTNQYW
jgi:hypothetical protein